MIDREQDPVTGVWSIRLSLKRDPAERKALGQRIRTERARRGWTLRQAADRMGDVSEQYIGMVERGERRPSQEAFVRLLGALELAPEILPDGGVSFWCAEGTEHVTVYLTTFSPRVDVVTPEWDAARQAEDTAKLGQVVSMIARDREKLIEVHRYLGLDEDFLSHLQHLDDLVDWARGR